MSYGQPYCRRCENILHSVQRGHTKCLKYFLNVTSENLNEILTIEKYVKAGVIHEDRNGEYIQKREMRMHTTLLHIACRKGYGDCVRILLEDKRVDPNILLDDVTPLFMMCDMGDGKFDATDIILLLLKHPHVEIISEEDPHSAFMHYILSYQHNIDEDVFKAFLKKETCVDLVFRELCTGIRKQSTMNYYVKLILSSNKVSEGMIYEVYDFLKRKDLSTEFYTKVIMMVEEYINSLPVIKEPGIQ